MSKLPEGRKALPNEWFIDRANRLSQSDIRPMTNDEKGRAMEKEKANSDKGNSKGSD
jgi:hypothetical protein